MDEAVGVCYHSVMPPFVTSTVVQTLPWNNAHKLKHMLSTGHLKKLHQIPNDWDANNTIIVCALIEI